MSVRRIEKKYKVVYKRGPSTVAMFFAGIAITSWLVFLIASGVPVVQYAYYKLRPSTSEKLAKVLYQAIAGKTYAGEKGENEANQIIEPVLPPIDTSLPTGHFLSIKKIGVDTQMWEASESEYEQALKRGVWRVPEMATPENGKPVILAAHRFGYLAWSNEYRRKNSFFNLPKLQASDKIEVIWDQRRYEYEVVSVKEGEQIDNYDVDLILYTCKFLTSPAKYFVYAKRIN